LWFHSKFIKLALIWRPQIEQKNTGQKNEIEIAEPYFSARHFSAFNAPR
jgi:hypothetical protein